MSPGAATRCSNSSLIHRRRRWHGIDGVRTRHETGILRHEVRLQAIGTANNGNRLAGAPGYDASASYVERVAQAAGLNVSSNNFHYELDFLADYKAPMRRFDLQHADRFNWFSAEESGLLGSEGLRRRAPVGGAGEDQGDAQLRHDRFTEFRALRVRRRRQWIAARIGRDRAAVPRVPRQPGPADRTDAVRRSVRLRAVHRGRLPAGGLFTGAEGIKTPAQAEVHGGTAGQQYDPCYHLGCDNIGNLSVTALEQMADAAAHVTLTLAQREGEPLPSAGLLAQSRASAAGAASGLALPQPLTVGGS